MTYLADSNCMIVRFRAVGFKKRASSREKVELTIFSFSCVQYRDSKASVRCTTFNDPLSMSETDEVECKEDVCKSCNGGCSYHTIYQDGSGVHAKVRRVNMTLGDVSTKSAVGMVYRSSPSFRYDAGTQTDGLLGISFSKGYRTIMDDMISKSGSADTFALQLGPKGGALSIGGYNPNYFEGNISWTKMLGNGIWYETPLPSIKVGNMWVSYNSPTSKAKSVIDSGTTHLLVPSAVLQQIVAYVKAAVSSATDSPPKSFSGPFKGSFFDHMTCHDDVDLAMLPPIFFTFEPKTASDGKFTLTLQPHQYVYALRSSDGRPCYSFGFAEGPSSIFIFGDTFMTSYYTIFDRQNRRIGFAESTNLSEVVPTSEPVTLVKNPAFSSASISRAPLPIHYALISISLLFSSILAFF